jgi:hypothetical protein
MDAPSASHFFGAFFAASMPYCPCSLDLWSDAQAIMHHKLATSG